MRGAVVGAVTTVTLTKVPLLCLLRAIVPHVVQVAWLEASIAMVHFHRSLPASGRAVGDVLGGNSKRRNDLERMEAELAQLRATEARRRSHGKNHAALVAAAKRAHVAQRRRERHALEQLVDALDYGRRKYVLTWPTNSFGTRLRALKLSKPRSPIAPNSN